MFYCKLLDSPENTAKVQNDSCFNKMSSILNTERELIAVTNNFSKKRKKEIETILYKIPPRYVNFFKVILYGLNKNYEFKILYEENLADVHFQLALSLIRRNAEVLKILFLNEKSEIVIKCNNLEEKQGSIVIDMFLYKYFSLSPLNYCLPEKQIRLVGELANNIFELEYKSENIMYYIGLNEKELIVHLFNKYGEIYKADKALKNTQWFPINNKRITNKKEIDSIFARVNGLIDEKQRRLQVEKLLVTLNKVIYTSNMTVESVLSSLSDDESLNYKYLFKSFADYNSGHIRGILGEIVGLFIMKQVALLSKDIGVPVDIVEGNVGDIYNLSENYYIKFEGAGNNIIFHDKTRGTNNMICELDGFMCFGNLPVIFESKILSGSSKNNKAYNSARKKQILNQIFNKDIVSLIVKPVVDRKDFKVVDEDMYMIELPIIKEIQETTEKIISNILNNN